MLVVALRLRCVLYVCLSARYCPSPSAEQALVTKEDVDTLKYDWLTDNICRFKPCVG
jgi:hypothetical protein